MVVDPKWLLKAFAAVVAVALVFAYIAVCMLFYHGQWQLVLHPSRAPERQPADAGLQAQAVTFGDGLKGWWIPSQTPSDPTVLMLPAGDGNAGDWLFRAKTLHASHVNVLLFDYRGYGASAGQHPEEKTMQVDAESALSYLTASGRVSAGRLLVFGAGVGASLAVRLCSEHPEITLLVLEEPDGDFYERARRDARASIAPFGMLFHEDFPLADALHRLKTPKLLITYTKGPPPAIVERAGDPKTTLEIPSASDEGEILHAVRRSLDAYVTRPVQVLR
jgi:pimeloyl-ACP methyl ester carboxylesterase